MDFEFRCGFWFRCGSGRCGFAKAARKGQGGKKGKKRVAHGMFLEELLRNIPEAGNAEHKKRANQF